MKVSLTRLWRKDAPKPRNAVPSQDTAASPVASSASPLPVWPSAGTAALAWIGPQGTACTALCQIQSRSGHELRLWIDEALGPDDSVWLILDDGVSCAGRILTCHRAEEFDDKFEVHIALIQAGPAATGSSATHLNWLDSSGVVAQEQVSLQNAEQGQLQVVLNEPLPVPSIVLLAAKGFQCLGSVSRCEPGAGRWALAIEVLGEAYSRSRE
jgi:hypothetical protein